MRCYLLIIIGIMISSLLGCAATDQNMRFENNYKSIFQQQIAHVPDGSSLQQSLPEVTSDELEKMGDIYFNQGNLQKAFLNYEKSLRLKPDNARVHYKKGVLLVVGGMNKDAITEFQEVLKKDPKYALAYEGLGQAFFQMQEYEDAEKQLRKAIELDPKLWKTHNLLGVIYDYKKNHGNAIREYRAAIALKPGDGILYNNLGISHSLNGDYEKAIRVYWEALENTTSLRKIYNNLGLVLAKQRRYQEALEAFRKGGDEAQAYNNLGCVYLQQGKLEKAIRCFEKAIENRSTFYARARDNLKKARMAYVYQSSFDFSEETPFDGQTEGSVADLKKEPKKREKLTAGTQTEPVVQAPANSEQLMREKKPAGYLKESIETGRNLPIDLALPASVEILKRFEQTPEYKANMEAFLEKKDPPFKPQKK